MVTRPDGEAASSHHKLIQLRRYPSGNVVESCKTAEETDVPRQRQLGEKMNPYILLGNRTGTACPINDNVC